MKRKTKKDERDAAKHSYNEDDDVDFFDDHATSFRIKNSWGDDFADKGYFRVEADAFPKGFDQYRQGCCSIIVRYGYGWCVNGVSSKAKVKV